MEPVRWDGECAVFTMEQLDSKRSLLTYVVYGEPWRHGFNDYIVTSSLDYERPLKEDWKFSQDRVRLRPIHRYSRIKRFESILYQLIGYRGLVPDSVVEVISSFHYACSKAVKFIHIACSLTSKLCRGCCRRRDMIWDSIREVLKFHKLRVYYNRIGNIIWHLEGWKIKFGDSYLFLEGIVDAFRRLRMSPYREVYR